MVGVGGDLELFLEFGLYTSCLHHFGNGVLTTGDALRKEFPVDARRTIIVFVLRIVNDFDLLLERFSNL